MQSTLDTLSQGTPLTGVVKAWYEDKGFGFLMPDGGGPDVFCHRNQLSDGTIPETGTQVTFEVRFNSLRGKYEATSCQGAGVLPAAKTALESLGVSTGIGGNKQVSDNLFVAGLPVDFSEDRVRALFSQYGVVKQCKVLPANGKPDTAALIRMADLEKAQFLVDHLNGTTPQGLPGPISVRYADNRAEKAKALSIVMGSPAPSSYGAAVGGSLASNRFAPYDPYGSVGGADSMLAVSDASALAAATAATMGAAQPPAQVSAASADAGTLTAAALISALAPALGQLGAALGVQTQPGQDLQGLIQTLQSLQNTLAAAGIGALTSSGAAPAPAGNHVAGGLSGLGALTSAGLSLGTPAAAGDAGGLAGLGVLATAGTPAGAHLGIPAAGAVTPGLSALPSAGAATATPLAAGAPGVAGLAAPTAPAGNPAGLAALSSSLASLAPVGGTTIAADAGLANLGALANLTSAGTAVGTTNMAAGAIAAPPTQIGAIGGSASALGDALAAALAGTGITLP